MKRTIAVATLVIALGLLLGIVPSAQAGQDQSCSNASLSGSFGFTNVGTLDPEARPFAEVGRQTFDGDGHTAGAATVNVNGNSFPVTVEGTYTVNADCIGSLTLTVSPLDITVHNDFVITGNGTEFRGITTDPGSVMTDVGKKQ